MTEEHLPGGFVTAVVRVGDTVRRTRSPNAAFTHRLLAHLERHGFPGAPRLLGVDEHGREILSYVDGRAAWQPTVHSRQSLAAVARLLRRFHDLTAGSGLAGDSEVVCHNDLSPKNTVYRGDEPVAFIDWDLAAPGRRIHDVAHVCWQYIGLGPGVTDPAAAGRDIRAIADAYGLADPLPSLIDTVLWWQDRCWRGIEAEASAGVAAAARLRGLGVVETIKDQHLWTAAQRRLLETG